MQNLTYRIQLAIALDNSNSCPLLPEACYAR